MKLSGLFTGCMTCHPCSISLRIAQEKNINVLWMHPLGTINIHVTAQPLCYSSVLYFQYSTPFTLQVVINVMSHKQEVNHYNQLKYFNHWFIFLIKSYPQSNKHYSVIGKQLWPQTTDTHPHDSLHLCTAESGAFNSWPKATNRLWLGLLTMASLYLKSNSSATVRALFLFSHNSDTANINTTAEDS